MLLLLFGTMDTTQKQKIAIVGSGIAGLTAGYFLSQKYEVGGSAANGAALLVHECLVLDTAGDNF